MTEIKFVYDNNVISGFEIKGHSGFNPGGPDILCASISATSQMTTNGILDWIGVDYEEVVKECSPRAGTLVVEVPNPFYLKLACQHLLKSFKMYVEGLAELYPDYVKVERSELDDH